MEDNLNKWILPEDKAEWAARDAGIYLHWGKTIQVADTRDPLQCAEAQMKLLAQLEPEIEGSSGGWFYMQSCPQNGSPGVSPHRGRICALPLGYSGRADSRMTKWPRRGMISIPGGMHLTRAQKVVPPYGIPYRSLVPKNTEGLLTAGRIISGTHIAASLLSRPADLFEYGRSGRYGGGYGGPA